MATDKGGLADFEIQTPDYGISQNVDRTKIKICEITG